MKPLLIAALTAALCACGGSSSSSGGSNGTTAAFVVQPTTCNVTVSGVPATVSLAGVVTAAASRSLGNACTAAANVCSVNYKNLTTLEVTVINSNLTGGTATAVGPGTYTLNQNPLAGPVVAAFESTTDASCAEVGSGLSATAGSVRLTAVGSTVSGSYQFTMSDNTTRSGTLSASDCGSALPGGSSFCDFATGTGPSCSGTPTCQ